MYTRGNPLKYTDPSGHLSEDEIRRYYGYAGDDKDALRKAMLDDEWGEDLVDWLLHSDTQFGDIFTYYDASGDRLGEAMLALFETSNGSYEGGFYGLSGTSKGIRVSRSQIGSFRDYTREAENLMQTYENAYDRLPRKSGSDGRNYYDPVLWVDYSILDTMGTGATLVGGIATAMVAVGCLSNPAGWVACMGGGAGLTSLGTTAFGTAYTIARPPSPTHYPLLRNSGNLNNLPVWRSFNAPRGTYE
jgi:hypothetical protein